MLSVQNREEQPPADVFWTTLATLMLSVNQSVPPTQSVQTTRPVWITSVQIPVLGSVVSMPHVELQIICLNVPVIQDTLGIHLSLVGGKRLVSFFLVNFKLNVVYLESMCLTLLIFSSTYNWKSWSLQSISLWKQCCLHSTRTCRVLSMHPWLFWGSLCSLQTGVHDKFWMPLNQGLPKPALRGSVPQCTLWKQCTMPSSKPHTKLCLPVWLYWRPFHCMSPASKA